MDVLSNPVFQQALAGAINAWAGRPVDTTLTEHLGEWLGEDTASALVDTIDLVLQETTNVREARVSGMTRQGWLGDTLKELAGGELSEQGTITLPLPGIGDMGPSTPAGLARQLLEPVLGGIGESFGSPIDLRTLPSLAEGAASMLDSVFNSPMDSEVERAVTAVASGAVHEWLNDEGVEAPVQAVVGAVGLGVSTAKAAFKVASGELPLTGGLEFIEDRACATLGAMARTACTRAGGELGEQAGAFIASYVGLAPLGATAGRMLGHLAGAQVGKVVEKGIKKVGPPILRGVRKAAVAGMKKAASLFGSLFRG